MTESEDTPRTSQPAARRARLDPWEAIVRQELLRARRRRSPRFVAQSGIERVVPGLRKPRPADPPQDPA